MHLLVQPCFTIACHTTERRRAAEKNRSIGALPPVKITRRAAAERMTSAQGSALFKKKPKALSIQIIL